MKRPPSAARSVPEQSDIIIRPDGRVCVSFLWEGLRPLAEALGAAVPESAPAPSASPAPARSSRAAIPFPLDEYRACRLCPKRCGIDRVARRHPTCGDYRLRIATAGLTLGDEPEIRGHRGSGAIMLSGCPLRCPSCHNPEMVANGCPVTIEQFLDVAWDLRARGAHNLQLLSPTVHLPALGAALAALRREGFDLPIVLKSSGYEHVEAVRALDGLVDVYLPDLKFGPRSGTAQRAAARDYFEVACAAIVEMARQVGPLVVDGDGIAVRGLLVRHVMAPLPSEEREAVLSFLRKLPPGTRVSVTDNFVPLE